MIDCDDLQNDIIDSFDEEGTENISTIVMESLLGALAEEMSIPEATALMKKALAAALDGFDPDADDEDDDEPEASDEP